MSNDSNSGSLFGELHYRNILNFDPNLELVMGSPNSQSTVSTFKCVCVDGTQNRSYIQAICWYLKNFDWYTTIKPSHNENHLKR